LSEKRNIITGLLFLFALSLFHSGVWGKPTVIRKAPDITVRQWVTKNPPDITNLDGKVYVVDFWATWCNSCVKGIGDLNEINAKYADKGLVFLSLCQDKTTDKLNKILEENKVNFHVAIDNGTVDWYEIECYPTVAVVNHKGKIVWQGRPWDTKFDKAIAKAIKAGSRKLAAR